MPADARQASIKISGGTTGFFLFSGSPELMTGPASKGGSILFFLVRTRIKLF